MNFNHTAKIGSTISFHILRGGKKVHVHENLHNILLHSTLNNYFAFDLYSMFTQNSGTGVTTFDTNTSYAVVPNSSTYQQVGTSITRVSGSDPLPDLIYTSSSGRGCIFWPGGVFGGYVTSTHNLAAGTATMSRSVNVSPTTGLVVFSVAGVGTAYDSPKQFSTSLTWNAASYLNGVSTVTMTTTKRLDVAQTAYTLRSICLNSMSSTTTRYTSYNLPSPITVRAGDQVVIDSISFTITFSTIAPITFAQCPITGITTSGKYQKLMPFDRRMRPYGSTSNVTRLYYVTSGNEIVLPDIPAPGAATIKLASITPAATSNISNVSDMLPIADVYEMLEGQYILNHATANVSNVKQIFFGDQTTESNLFAAIEFDTPQNFVSTKFLTLRLGTRIFSDYPVIT